LRWDPTLLDLTRLIVHEVPNRPVGGGGSDPILSDEDRAFESDVRDYFRDRIAESLRSAAVDVVFDPTTASPVPALVLHGLGDPGALVKLSREIASHLYVSQTGVNSGGLLTVVVGSLGDSPAVAIMKLEKEEGIRVLQRRAEGHLSFDMQFLHDLMLNKRTKVFKVGLFIQEGDGPNGVFGAVSDNQMGVTTDRDVARFFLHKFLGCRFAEEPEMVTKRLYEAAQLFINQDVHDPQDKGRYEIALVAELQNNEETFDARIFADHSLKAQHRQLFLDRVAQQGVAGQRIVKDLGMIKGILKRIQVQFESGVAVIAQPRVFEEQVRMTSLPDGRTRVEIEDRLRDIRTKGG
jgi:hypothetical protein